jgi:hypothetical protein
MDYIAILKQAYVVTVRHPKLWLLGLFLAGGFNTNFIYWLNLRVRWRQSGFSILSWFNERPDIQVWVFVIISIALLIMVIVLANWIKITFVLKASDLLKLQRMKSHNDYPDNSFIGYFQEGKTLLPSVIAMSVFTMAITVVLLTVLGGSPSLLFHSRGLVWLMAVAVFIALVFFISCLNVFGSFFIIFYKQRFAPALNLALDLVTSRWRVIIEMGLIVMIIYSAYFFGLSALLATLRFFLFSILYPLSQSGIITESTVQGIAASFSAVLLWFGLAIVNTFFNLSLLLLFARLVKPPYHPEFKSLLAESPTPTPLASARLSGQNGLNIVK